MKFIDLQDVEYIARGCSSGNRWWWRPSSWEINGYSGDKQNGPVQLIDPDEVPTMPVLFQLP